MHLIWFRNSDPNLILDALLLNCIKLPWFAVFVKLRERPVLHSGILSKLVDFLCLKDPKQRYTAMAKVPCAQQWGVAHIPDPMIPWSDLKITCQNWFEDFWQFDTVWPLFHLVKCMDFGLLNTLFALLAVLIWILKRGDFGSEGRTCTNCRLPMFLGETLEISVSSLFHFEIFWCAADSLTKNWWELRSERQQVSFKSADEVQKESSKLSWF